MKQAELEVPEPGSASQKLPDGDHSQVVASAPASNMGKKRTVSDASVAESKKNEADAPEDY